MDSNCLNWAVFSQHDTILSVQENDVVRCSCARRLSLLTCYQQRFNNDSDEGSLIE